MPMKADHNLTQRLIAHSSRVFRFAPVAQAILLPQAGAGLSSSLLLRPWTHFVENPPGRSL
jgi:hypothetical protein